jgi:hypothetical protein
MHFLSSCGFWDVDSSDDEKAQQSARANAGACHESCFLLRQGYGGQERRPRANPSRGLSLTLGKRMKPISPFPSEEEGQPATEPERQHFGVLSFVILMSFFALRLVLKLFGVAGRASIGKDISPAVFWPVYSLILAAAALGAFLGIRSLRDPGGSVGDKIAGTIGLTLNGYLLVSGVIWTFAVFSVPIV